MLYDNEVFCRNYEQDTFSKNLLPRHFLKLKLVEICFPEAAWKYMWENHPLPPPKQQYTLDSFDPLERKDT